MILKIGRQPKGGIGKYAWILYCNTEFVEGGHVTLAYDERVAAKSVLRHLKPMLESYGLDIHNKRIDDSSDPYTLKYVFE